MGISFIIVQSNKKCYPFCNQLVFFIIQLGFNLMWSTLFFKMKKPLLALLDLIFTLGFTLITFYKFYFIHSYYAVNIDEKNLVSYYYLNKNKIPAIIKKNNIVGCQFHPEKSSKQGLNLIKAFLEGNL